MFLYSVSSLLLTKPDQSQDSRELADGIHAGWKGVSVADGWERQGEDP